MAEEEVVPSVRDSINAVIEKAEPSNATTIPETPAATPAPEGAAPSAPQGDSPPLGSEKAEAVPQKPEAPAAAPADPGAKPPVGEKPKPEAAKPVGFKAPESWRPAVREQWKTLAPQVQAEIIRRERQIEDTLKHTVQARQVAEGLGQIYANFQDVFKGESTPPLQTIANLLNISRTLKTAPPPQRAQLMAQVIQQYGVDLQLLDQALAFHVQNAPKQDGVNQFQQMMAQSLAPIHQQLGALVRERQMGQQQAQQEQNQTLINEVETFAADPKNEYFELLRNDVADILEMGARRGQPISLSQAYTRAMLANNELAPLVSQAMLREAAAQQNAPAAAALQRAGFSVTGAPSLGAPQAGDASKSVRGAIEGAIQQLSGRQ